MRGKIPETWWRRHDEYETEGGKRCPKHRIGTQEEWQAEREELLKEEKELTHRGDELTKERQALPWVPVEKDYEFETTDGTKSLAELFDGRSQLMIYHFMFGPPYDAGCTVCSSIADNINANAPHLMNGGDVTVLLASRAPLDRLQAYKERMGWDNLDWVSTAATTSTATSASCVPRRS